MTGNTVFCLAALTAQTMTSTECFLEVTAMIQLCFLGCLSQPSGGHEATDTSYRKAPVTQAKWSLLFHWSRVLLSNSLVDSFALLIAVNLTYSPPLGLVTGMFLPSRLVPLRLSGEGIPVVQKLQTIFFRLARPSLAGQIMLRGHRLLHLHSHNVQGLGLPLWFHPPSHPSPPCRMLCTP